MSLRIGEIVIVNKDVFRVEMSNNTRTENLYASKGDMGVVINLFSPVDAGDKGVIVQIETIGGIKSFRLESLDKASEWGF